MTDTPNRGIPYVPEATLDPAAGLNLALNVIDALLQVRVISMALSSPPVTNGDGDLYIVKAPGAGAWAGHSNDLARYVGAGDFWQFFEAGTTSTGPNRQISYLFNGADGTFYVFDDVNSPVGWKQVQGGGGGLTTEIDIGIFFPGGPPSANQLLGKFVAPVALQFPANFSGSVGHIGTNPTASFAMDVSAAGVSIGTITVSTGGVFTFTTQGGGVKNVSAGEQIEIEGPGSADATAADIAFTLLADVT